ncbi:MAG: Na+/H+ antiporter NhaC family protein [Eubacterium sp.]|nr:Na+/H+ antiporter NhaC family protein [Eubacterium sp.]
MSARAKKRLLISLILLVMVGLIIYTLCTKVVVGEDYQSPFFATWVALLPPIVAIVLALLTKEVYSSLFLGIFTGALLYSQFDLELALQTILFGKDIDGDAAGLVPKLTDSWNAGILVFLVVLGIIVVLMNKAGGSAAFGRLASRHIKTRVGAQMATIALGILIFVDDYFNCLTVGSVMRPVTDNNKISRAKLAYLIDATAAPICIIAPISSWAAAVTSSVPEEAGINGFQTFLKTIPCNFYALLTIIMMFYITIRKVDFGPMRKHELNAIKGDLFTTGEVIGQEEEKPNSRGRVLDLVLPVLVLIISCVIAMVYTGGFFEGESFIDAFANSDASVGLALGSIVALGFTFFYYMLRDVMTFREFMECIPKGFIAMVAPILILCFAWTHSGMTGLLGAKVFVADMVAGSAAGLQALLPAVIFLVALGLAFSTGTSWGTFGILIPIVMGVFPSGDMMVLSISACLAGAVCGDHCSPISDTTIMASAGAQSNHVNHVSTQLPYALTVAAVSAVSYVIAGYLKNSALSLVIAIVLMIGTLIVIERIVGREEYDEGDRGEKVK